MEEQPVREIIRATHWPRMTAATALGALALFLFVATIAQLQGMRYIGAGIAATDTISVEGHGEVFAVPDTAEFSFGVEDTRKDVASAQAAASKTENALVGYLKSQGIADADIQTTDYQISPQYEYESAACPNAPAAGAPTIYCPPGKQVLTGYRVSETISVKVRDTSRASDILAGVGSKGATDVSGLSLTVSNQNALEEEARGKAIADAEGKAQALARQLGVSLARIVGFSENAGNPVPYVRAMAASAPAPAPAPAIPAGQNKIASDVSITYEIR